MRTAIKLIAFLLILVIAAVVALPFVIDPNDYKEEISSQVEKATGRNLTLQGDIGLSVFPWVALELGPLSLSNAEGFKADAFAKVQAAKIRIKLLPLLKKQLEMDTIVLDGLVLNLETNKDGKTNWDDLAKGEDASAEKPAEQKEKTSAPALEAVNIAGVELTNANILWSDASKGESFQLRNLNLNTEPLTPNSPTAVDMAFDLISTKPEAKAHVTLTSDITADMKRQNYALDNLKFTTIATGKALPVSQMDVSLTGKVNADLAKQVATISNLVLDAKANNDKQTISATMTANVNSNLASQQTTIDDLAIKANVSDPALPGGKANLTINSQVQADLQQQTLTVSALAVQLQDLMMEANIKANGILTEPSFAGSAHIKPFSLRKLASNMKIALPEMADNTTLEKFDLATEFEGTTNSINAKQLNVTLDQSRLTGQLAINNFAAPAFNFALKLDQIDADRYLPPVKEETAKKPAKEAPAEKPASDNADTKKAADAAALPLEPLRQINAKGTIDIGKLKITGLSGENIHATIDAADGLVKLTPMSANIYQGTYNGNVILDARKKALSLSINEAIKGVQAEPLLKDMMGDAKISGTANMNIKMTGSGATVDAIKKTLNGSGGFSFTDGAVQGINIAALIRKAQAALSGQKLPESNEPVKTDFSSLAGTFTVTNGVINNQDLAVMSPLLRINGSGSASLPAETIDYALDTSIVGSIAGQGGAELAELKGVTIPVKIGGTFSEPKPSLDLAGVIKDKAKEELKSKAEEKIKEKLGDDLGGLLGGALGGEATSGDDAKGSNEATEQTTPKESAEDAIKNKLKDLL